jgi:hypothetical protein
MSDWPAMQTRRLLFHPSPVAARRGETAHPSTARAERNHRVALGMLRLQVQGNDGSWCFANIFADEGSDTTLERSAFATALKVRGSPQVLTVDGAGGVVTSYPSELIHFQVRAESGEIVTLEGSTMQKVASPAPTTDWSKEKMRWPHLRDLPVGVVGGKIDVLIGTDHLHLLAARESREGEDYVLRLTNSSRMDYSRRYKQRCPCSGRP